MTEHDWYLENRLAFATRTLEAEEDLAFANHLPQCDACRAAVLELRGLLERPVTPRAVEHRELKDAAADFTHDDPVRAKPERGLQQIPDGNGWNPQLLAACFQPD